MDFDLTVANNLMQDNNNSTVQRQVTGVFESKLPNDRRITSAQLVELNVQYAKQQSAFAHEVYTAVFNVKNCYFKPSISSKTCKMRSTILFLLKNLFKKEIVISSVKEFIFFRNFFNIIFCFIQNVRFIKVATKC